MKFYVGQLISPIVSWDQKGIPGPGIIANGLYMITNGRGANSEEYWVTPVGHDDIEYGIQEDNMRHATKEEERLYRLLYK